MSRGRPIRFIALVVSGWATARALLLWPADAVPGSHPAIATTAATIAARTGAAARADPTLSARDRFAPAASSSPRVALARAFSPARPPLRPPLRLAAAPLAHPVAPTARKPGDPELILLAAMAFPGAYRIALQPVAGFPAETPPPPASRWSGSAWLIARDGGRARLSSPLLGGAQAGARLVRTLDRSGRLAGFVRVDGPLGDGSPAGAAGIQWRPGKAPVTLLAEVRADGRTAAPAIGTFGGGVQRLPANFRLEGYGQAGAIARQRVVAYADGQLRVTRPLTGPFDAGLGAWGAAQPGVARLDIGPTLALPLASRRPSLRVTLDWRHRIAGNARPASGPVLSLGSDF